MDGRGCDKGSRFKSKAKSFSLTSLALDCVSTVPLPTSPNKLKRNAGYAGKGGEEDWPNTGPTGPNVKPEDGGELGC